jgi:hypothetical protein
VESIRRIIEIATIDVLGLENSIARARVLIAAAMAATRLLEAGDFEARLEAVEAAVGTGRQEADTTVFADGFGKPGP